MALNKWSTEHQLPRNPQHRLSETPQTLTEICFPFEFSQRLTDKVHRGDSRHRHRAGSWGVTRHKTRTPMKTDCDSVPRRRAICLLSFLLGLFFHLLVHLHMFVFEAGPRTSRCELEHPESPWGGLTNRCFCGNNNSRLGGGSSDR